ncbi:MAG: hypothetical protein RBR93_12890 [Aliarcobacter butzleri]|nr:hypothetical protein [Aliarcobacter butzleri]
MKKLILGILLIQFLLAKDCIYKDNDFCIYIEKKDNEAKMILENTSKDTIKIIDGTVMLDGVKKTFKDFYTHPKYKIIAIRSKYKDKYTVPEYTVNIFNLEIIKEKGLKIINDNNEKIPNNIEHTHIKIIK